MKGECISGALTTRHLVAILEETGFESVSLLKRFPYRVVRGHAFFSLTYSAVTPKASEPVSVIYRGPLPFIVTQHGLLLQKGVLTSMDSHEADLLGDQVFILDTNGHTLNIEAENMCAGHVAPEATEPLAHRKTSSPLKMIKQPAGCMVCAAPLVYTRHQKERCCAFCGMIFSSNSACESRHYVCDQCHAEDGIAVIRQICLHSDETDMIRLFEQIRRHPAIPVHGPEYHAMVPGVILAAYRLVCSQQHLNKECLGKACRLYPSSPP